MRIFTVFLLLTAAFAILLRAEEATGEGSSRHVRLLRVSPADRPGYARTETNVTSITRSSLVTAGNYQFAAYYDCDRPTVNIARRNLQSDNWEVFKTSFVANTLADSHDAISMGIDGKGYLHLSWGMHSQQLKYAKTLSPVIDPSPFEPRFGNVERELPGQKYNTDSFARVTYPEFYNVPGSDDLILTYRCGSSGNGNQYLSRYDAGAGVWEALQPPGIPLISGEGIKEINGGANVNAYPNNLAFDNHGVLNLSWTWRTGGDTTTRAVALSGFQTNYNLLFACSRDAGKTWQRGDDSPYSLPITQATTGRHAAQIIADIPEGSSLINQASMAVDAFDRPVIATWWAPSNTDDPGTTDDTREYTLVYFDGQKWEKSQITHRRRESIIDVTHVPEMSQPLVAVDKDNRVIVVFRQDREHRGDGGLTAAYSEDRRHWTFLELSSEPLGDLEPTFDWVLWKRENKLAILLQAVGPVWNGKASVNHDCAPVDVLIWDTKAYFAGLQPAPAASTSK